MPKGAEVQTGSRKVRVMWVGPLVICQTYSPTQFALMTIGGIPFPGIYEETRNKTWLDSNFSRPSK